MPGARRARIITRDNLIVRLARLTGTTYGRAYDRAADLDDESLRDAVEKLEQRHNPPGGAHAAFRPMTTHARGIFR